MSSRALSNRHVIFKDEFGFCVALEIRICGERFSNRELGDVPFSPEILLVLRPPFQEFLGLGWVLALLVQHDVVDPGNCALVAVRPRQRLQQSDLLANLWQSASKARSMEGDRSFALTERANIILIVVACTGRINVVALHEIR